MSASVTCDHCGGTVARDDLVGLPWLHVSSLGGVASFAFGDEWDFCSVACLTVAMASRAAVRAQRQPAAS